MVSMFFYIIPYGSQCNPMTVTPFYTKFISVMFEIVSMLIVIGSKDFSNNCVRLHFYI